MTDLEQMLRQALADAPTPESSMSDVLGRVERRARRARLLIAGGTLAAVAAVTAAVVVPLSLVGRGRAVGPVAPPDTTPTGTPSPRPGRTPDVTPWPDAGVVGVAYGAGSVWTLQTSTACCEKSVVVRRDARDGHEIARFSVPSPGEPRIAFGLGRVWVLGGGDGGRGNRSAVSAVDPLTGRMVTRHYGHQGTPSDITFADGFAWVTLASANRVEALNRQDLQPVASVAVGGQPTDIVSTGDGHLWVSESLNERTADVVVRGSAARVAGDYSWGGPLFAPAPGGSIWTTDGVRLVRLTPRLLAAGTSVALGTRISLPAPAVAAVAGPPGGGGLWVAVHANGPQPPVAALRAGDSSRWTLGYFSAADLRSTDPRPSATTYIGGLGLLADDPAVRGVVFAGSELGRWSPAAVR